MPGEESFVTAQSRQNTNRRQDSSSEPSLGWRWALLILLSASAYRGLCFIAFGDHPLFQNPVVDASYHHEWARRIVAGDLLGHGPDDVFKPPLYPYFLAGIYAVFGRSVQLVQGIQYALGAISCLMASVLAARLLGRKVGVTVGILSALYAPYVFFETQLLTPALSIFFNLAALLMLVDGVDAASNRRLLAAGALFGLSAGIRPDMLLPAGLVAAYLLWRSGSPSWLKRAAKAGCLTLGLALAILPITIRNTMLTGQIIPIASNGGINFYTGNCALADGFSAIPVGLKWERLVSRVPQPVLERPADASQWWIARTWEEVAADPAKSVSRLAWKALAFFNGREFRNNICYHFMQERAWSLRFPFLQYSILLPLAMCGMISLWRSRSRPARTAMTLSVLWCGGFLIAGMIFFVTARYRLPMLPVLMIPAGWMVVETVSEVRLRRWRSLVMKTAVILAVGLVAWPMWLGRAQSGWALDYLNLGNALRSAGDASGATIAYRRALDFADDVDAHYLLARELLRRNQISEATRHLDAAMRLIPDSPDLLLISAQTRLAKGDPQRARELLAELLELSRQCNLWPRRAQWATAHMMLAELEPSAAQEHWEKAWAIHPLTAAEVCFQRRREMPRVLECFRAEAMVKPWDWYVQANYGMALFEMGYIEEAVVLLRRAVRLAPEKEGLCFQLARALVKTGDRKGALKILDESLRTLPDGPLRRDAEALRMQVTATGAPS